MSLALNRSVLRLSRTATFRDDAAYSLLARQALAPLAAAAFGLAAFSGHWQLLPASLGLPLVLTLCQGKAHAFAAVLAYQLAASWGLAAGAAEFFGTSIFFGMVIWCIGNLLSAALYGLFWSKSPGRRAAGFLAAVGLLAVPPLGVFGWASPITAAGALFPALGAAGIGLTLILLVALTLQRWGLAAVLTGLSLAASILYKPAAARIAAVSTAYGRPAATYEADYQRQHDLASQVAGATLAVVALPETSLLEWNEVSSRLWLGQMPRGKAVIIGTALPAAPKLKTQNALVFIENGQVQFYRQRQPVPLSMWRPWSSGGYAANWGERPTLEIGGLKVAPLLCYETFLVWPVVESMLAGGNHIVAASNLWWAARTSIPAVQRSITEAWSRLFNAPYSLAVNL